MGAIRSLPENEVNTLVEIHQDNDYYFVSVFVCGWQFFMEDFQVSITKGKKNFFAIIDGHNGPQIAEFCHEKITDMYNKNELIKMDQMLIGMQNLVYELEQTIYNSHADLNRIRIKNNLPALTKEEFTRAGCSIIMVAINQEQIVIGNVGPCRCYVTYKKDKSKAILFAGNHIASNKQQQARITKNGGFIYNNKVNGTYPFTRSIGDYHLKKNMQGKNKKDKSAINQGILICEPSLFSLRKQDIASILMGSSGIWEEPEKIGKTLTQLGKSTKQDQQQLQNLLNKMIASQPSEDKVGLQNMTITYINFLK